MKATRLTPCAAAVAAAVLQMTSPAQAANCTLTNNGLWQTPGDWSCNQEPGAGDSATINLNGLVTINQAEQITTLSNAGTINISAFGLTLLSGGSTTNSGTINVGGTTTASLTVQNNINNAGGTINVANGSAANVFSSTISGGTVATTGTGAMTLYNSSALDGSTQGTMTLSGNVNVAGGQTDYFYGTFNQTGNLVVGDGSNGTDFRILNNNNAALNGAGTLTLTGNSRVFGDNGNDGLTNGSGHTIQGAGQLGINQLYVTNNGLVNANVNGGTLQIDPTDGASGSSGGFINNGTIRASNGGNAQLIFAYYNNAAGTIEAQAGSTVTITNSAVVEGGTLATSGTGAVNLSNSGFLDGATVGAITINGKVNVVAGQTAYASGTLNGGSITVGDGSGNGTDLRIQGSNNLTLAGGGTLSLTNIATRIFGDNGNDGLTISAGNTVQGAGQIGINQAYVVNNGLITANLSGQTLQLDPTDGFNGAEGFINTGTLRAENGGNLSLLFGYYKNAGATITALNGSTVNLSNSAVIEGGTLSTAGTGTITLNNSVTLDGQTYGAMNLNGNILVAAGQADYAFGTLNTNSLTIGDGSANGTDLRIAGSNNLTLANNGTVSLTNISDRIFGDYGTDVLTNSAGNTIQGAGQIGINQAYVVNNGLITANLSGQTLQLDPSDGASGAEGFVNTGTLRAENGGNLVLYQGYYKNAGATITALNGSTVNLINSAVIEGGTLSTVGTGTITLNNSVTLDGQTYGAMNLTGNILVAPGQTDYAFGTLNTNSLTIGDGSANGTDLRISGSNNLTFANNGTVSLTNINDRIFADNGNDVLTNNVGNTIQGAGQIGINQAYVVNKGLITANLAGQTLQIDPSDGSTTGEGFVNTGTLRAENGGNLNFYFAYYNNNGGKIAALDGSTVNLYNSAIIEGGLLTTTGSGTITLNNSVTLDGTTRGALTNTGNVIIATGQTDYLTGSIVNNGTITQQTGADVRVAGSTDLTLSGTGTYTMAAGTRIFGDNGNDTLTNGSGHTIQGQGQIGINQLNLTNAGTINANVSGATLAIDVSNNSIANQTSGVLQASNGGTLNLNDAVNGTGTIRSDSGGTVVVNAASTTGRLINNANLSLGTNNVTVSADYNNANFGTGNSFDRRAGVTGTGLILASGDAAQAITGATVSNGTSATPTLTINNVRVGATTYNYQVTNSGTTGPAIRGAIQTSVNGGNITDSRLSGSGVTAGNYGPVATGANSGDLAVTFTATSAGALGPLNGQSVHIANNFDNLSQQTMNIVLASGAAAYNAAVGSASIASLGNTRVNGTLAGNITVSNTAPAGPYSEDLNASVSSSSGATTSGSISQLIAGQSSNAIGASLSTSTAGAKTGSVTLAYQTAGTVAGVSNGLMPASVGTQTVAVSGNVYQAAAGSILTSPLNFGTVQVGQSVSQALTVKNTATGASGFVEDLNASFGAATGTGANLITGSGAVSGLVAGATSNALTVGVNTSAAGTVNGSIAVNYVSAGAVNGVSNGLGTLAVGSDSYGVAGTITTSANVINQASPVINNPTIALGNVRVGATSPTAAVSVTNQATTSPQAALTASIAGNAPVTASGSFSLLNPGSTNASSLTVGINTSTAGSKSGTATVSFISDASNVGGCGTSCQLTLPSQNVSVTGGVFQVAAGSILTSPLNFGTVQVGQSVSQALTVKNTATGPTGYVEDLNASFGSASGTGSNLITGSGSISGLIAGATSNALTVGVNTSAAGTVNGSIAVNYVSAGAVNGVSNGLGTLAVGSDSYGVSGTITTSANVINQASPVVNTPTIALGNVRIGTASPTSTVSVTNQSTASPQAALDASIAGNAPITASGSFNLLSPGSTDASSLKVGLDTSTAGAKNGTATISFISDANNVGGCGTNCQLTLASQNVAVSGAVYRLANPTVASPTTLAARVGGSATTTIGVTNSSPDVYTEGLTATRGATAAGFTSSGSITNLAAQGTSNAITVALNTMTAGTFTGTQALNFASTGAGTDGAADLALAGQNVTLNGKVYTPAVAQSNTSSVNFGIVHVGQSVTAQGVSVTNAAPVTALNDVLVSSAIGATGPFTAIGSLGAGLAAGQTSTNGLQVGLTTTAAGIYSGSATFSAASHDGDLSDAALSNLAVSLAGQVNNYATDAFKLAGGSGSFSQSGTVYTLDFGSVVKGSGTESATLVAGNTATGPADLLDGSFQFLDPTDFGESGFSAFANLAAGQDTGGLGLTFDTSTVGTFMDTIVLSGVGHNASGYSGALGDIELVVRGTVTAEATTGVPEPATLALLGLGIPLLLRRRGRKTVANG